MIDLTKVRNFYIACGYTDLRLGIDGLAADAGYGRPDYSLVGEASLHEAPVAGAVLDAAGDPAQGRR